MLTWMPELYNRSLMRMTSFTDEEMLSLIDLAAQLKARRAAGIRGDLLHRKNVALIFEKSSTRTRNSALIAIRDEGGNAEYLTRPDIHFGKKESVKDTARVLGRIYDGILFRGFAQKTVEDLAKYSGVPVWNGLTDDYHPTQILADLLTIKETFGSLKDCTVAYVGDGRNNVANSLMMGCAKAGVRYVCCTPKELWPEERGTPKELWPEERVLAEAGEVARRNGVDVRVFDDPVKGVKGANVLYTDVWVSMGEESKTAERIKLLSPYQVNMDLMRATGNIDGRLLFLHSRVPRPRDGRHARERRPGGDGRGVRVEVLEGVRRVGEPHAHDQGALRLGPLQPRRPLTRPCPGPPVWRSWRSRWPFPPSRTAATPCSRRRTSGCGTAGSTRTRSAPSWRTCTRTACATSASTRSRRGSARGSPRRWRRTT